MGILRITSKDNKVLKEMRQPKRDGRILVEGPKLIAEALTAKLPMQDVVVASSKVEKYEGLLHRCEEAGSHLLEAPDRIITGIGDAVTGQGIIALAGQPEMSLDQFPRTIMGLILALDTIQDPGNVGAMIRSAFAFGITAVVALDGTANPLGSKAIRASAGTCFHMPVAMAQTSEFLKHAHGVGMPLVALDGTAETDISDAELPADCAIIVGNEGAGIRAELRHACAAAYRIPISPDVESLNAAVAASIAMYEIARKRTTR